MPGYIAVTSGDGEVGYGEVAIPAELFDEARQVGACAITWGKGTITLQFGHENGITLYLYKKED
jgi:2-methylisocitrate lyase-like PEP mutase family enzyme